MLGEGSRLTQDPVLFTVEEQEEIRSGFLATRTQLPVMVIVTPQDRKLCMDTGWTLASGAIPSLPAHL